MSKKNHDDYKNTLRELQIELVKLQRHLISHELQILILIEGRDAAGKDGVIKRITQHLSPRETRVVALRKPSAHTNRAWYFQRFVAHLPSIQEMVLMNRSWYNRAGVERVMGFCSDAEYENFMSTVVSFEHLLQRSGIQLLKYYLDISKKEQKKRLEKRRLDPLTQWKSSPIDEVSLENWDNYSDARNEMLRRTHSELAPWYVVKANNKKSARINLIRHILAHVECQEKDLHKACPDPEVIAPFSEELLCNGFIAK